MIDSVEQKKLVYLGEIEFLASTMEKEFSQMTDLKVLIVISSGVNQ